VPAGEAEGAPVDAPEAALADHEQRAEVGRGAAELPEAELPQAVRAPLLSDPGMESDDNSSDMETSLDQSVDFYEI
jgi:hypothetical protein